MPKLRIYLDTSVISHLFHDDAPERQAVTRELFENAILPRLHDTYVSGVVLNELTQTTDPVRRKMLLDAVTRYDLSILPKGDDEIDRLAQCYVDQGIVPAEKYEDALHVAYATVFEMDVLVTWNYRHLAKAKTSALIAVVNMAEGYARTLRVLTPMEVLEP